MSTVRCSIPHTTWRCPLPSQSNSTYIQGVFFTGSPPKSTDKLIWAGLGVSRKIYVNVDSPNLGFPYFNFLQWKKHPVSLHCYIHPRWRLLLLNCGWHRVCQDWSGCANISALTTPPSFFPDEKLLPLYQSERREPAIQMEISLPQSALIPSICRYFDGIFGFPHFWL